MMCDVMNARDARGGGHCSGGDDADDEAAKMATRRQLLLHVLPTLLAALAPPNTSPGLLFLIWFSSGVLHLRVFRLYPTALESFLLCFSHVVFRPFLALHCSVHPRPPWICSPS